MKTETTKRTVAGICLDCGEALTIKQIKRRSTRCEECLATHIDRYCEEKGFERYPDLTAKKPAYVPPPKTDNILVVIGTKLWRLMKAVRI